MAVYKVGSDGKAPKGLSVNDQVVTGGGTYTIRGVNGDGTYQSELTNAGQTTQNYTGQYATTGDKTNYQALINNAVAAGNYVGAAQYEQKRNQKIANEGLNYSPTYTWQSFLNTSSGNPASLPEYQDGGTDAYIQQLLQSIQNQQNINYTPVDQNQYMDQAMTFEEAYELAQQVIDPQYQAAYASAAAQSAQNLGKAGLYDSLYGQVLMQNAQNAVTADKNSALGQLALQLQGQSRDQAMALLQMAINENQFGTNVKLDAAQNTTSALTGLIGLLQNEANARNDYALSAASLQLQQQEAAIMQRYYAGQITGQELNNEISRLELEAQRQALSAGVPQSKVTAASSGGGGGKSSSSSAGGSGDYTFPQLVEQLRNDTPTGTVAARGEYSSAMSETQKQLLDNVINGLNTAYAKVNS